MSSLSYENVTVDDEIEIRSTFSNQNNKKSTSVCFDVCKYCVKITPTMFLCPLFCPLTWIFGVCKTDAQLREDETKLFGCCSVINEFYCTGLLYRMRWLCCCCGRGCCSFSLKNKGFNERHQVQCLEELPKSIIYCPLACPFFWFTYFMCGSNFSLTKQFEKERSVRSAVFMFIIYLFLMFLFSLLSLSLTHTLSLSLLF